jgi:hypothetical protein
MNRAGSAVAQPAERSTWTIAVAVVITSVTLGLGWCAFDLLTMLVFAAGFAGGLVLWLVFPTGGSWRDIRWPYWITLLLFVIHRVEEKQAKFFAFLSIVTGTPTPSATSLPVVLLVAVSVGAWLLIPILMGRNHPLVRYLAWTFFTSMGVTELAHFGVFPWLNPGGITAYVPGMWTVLVLAAFAWWGMWRLKGDQLASAADGATR